MRIVCLLPARNAVGDLAQWFESVEPFADAVIALDDGSTDGTGDALDAHPLVEVLLRNPPRDGHAGWNDSVNRNRLLDAARALEPSWIISIDTDERVPPEDGEALRRFVHEQAVDGIGYGFPRYRMIDDLQHYDIREDHAYRLFAYRPGQVFPDDRLHFMPVPTSIPQHRWLATDLRIQHLCGLTTEHRQVRRQKYREADPDQRWERDYSYVETPTGELKTWPRRRAGEPVILEARFGWDPSEGEPDLDWPVLSTVLIVDENAIDEMVDLLDAVGEQECRHPSEVIVLARGEPVADDVARLRPGTTVIAIPSRSFAGSARNVGLEVARGDYVIFFDAPAVLAPGALGAVVDAHDQGHAVVSGCTVNQVPSATGWASYFDDPGHGSFARAPLLRLGGFDERVEEAVDAVARDQLVHNGHRVAHTPLIAFGHRTELRTPIEYWRQCLARGRATGGPLGHDTGTARDRTGRPDDEAEALRRVRLLRFGGGVATRVGAALTQVRRVRGPRV